LTLHYVADKGQGLRLDWSREEGLSDIKQIEIVNEHADNRRMEHHFDYIHNWNQDGTYANAPQRILNRYVENLSFIAKSLMSVGGQDQTDIYGFRKTLIALTNSAKIISFSSMDGSVLWTSSYFKFAPLRILLRNSYNRESEMTDTHVVSCFSD